MPVIDEAAALGFIIVRTQMGGYESGSTLWLTGNPVSYTFNPPLGSPVERLKLLDSDAGELDGELTNFDGRTPFEQRLYELGAERARIMRPDATVTRIDVYQNPPLPLTPEWIGSVAVNVTGQQTSLGGLSPAAVSTWTGKSVGKRKVVITHPAYGMPMFPPLPIPFVGREPYWNTLLAKYLDGMIGGRDGTRVRVLRSATQTTYDQIERGLGLRR